MAAAFEHDIEPNRTNLLPWWIRYCNWFFILAIITVPIVFISSLVGSDRVYFEAYGFTARNVFSLTGILLAVVFLFNAFTAYALLTENDWAIDIAIIDAFIGIGFCLCSMSIHPGTFRYELVPLVFFLIKILDIRTAWERLK